MRLCFGPGDSPATIAFTDSRKIAAAQWTMQRIKRAQDIEVVSIEASVGIDNDDIKVDAVVKYDGDYGMFVPISLDGPDGLGCPQYGTTYYEEVHRYKMRVGGQEDDPEVEITLHRKLFKD